jgi:hypothetical protein
MSFSLRAWGRIAGLPEGSGEKQKAAFNATGMTAKCAGCDMQKA